MLAVTFCGISKLAHTPIRNSSSLQPQHPSESGPAGYPGCLACESKLHAQNILHLKPPSHNRKSTISTISPTQSTYVRSHLPPTQPSLQPITISILPMRLKPRFKEPTPKTSRPPPKPTLTGIPQQRLRSRLPHPASQHLRPASRANPRARAKQSCSADVKTLDLPPLPPPHFPPRYPQLPPRPVQPHPGNLRRNPRRSVGGGAVPRTARRKGRSKGRKNGSAGAWTRRLPHGHGARGPRGCCWRWRPGASRR